MHNARMRLLLIAAWLIAAYALAALAAPGIAAPFVAARLATLWLPTTAHIALGAVVLAGGALQFRPSLRLRHLAWHRRLGWIYAAGVLVSGVSGFVMATVSEGGPVTHWGFGLLAICWIATTGLAVRAVVRGDIDTHRRWMLRSYALTFAAVTLRIELALGLAAGVPFETVYRVVSWAAWVPNLVVVQWWTRRRR